ncbi:putative s-adenosylmethionine-dependent methyltransferase [Quercus suber]|uniref:S-adenosylmethionine-dependent methyltransferase n=1 Tax=Quercus suber TaxID=58331 RepID=A0AAW0LFR2_QUESU
MESFLIARAQELVIGGLLALFIPAVPDNMSKSDIFGGLTSEAKVDAFNLPGYFTSSKELKALIERSQHFNIERMEILNNQKKYVSLRNPSMYSLFLRAALEGVIAKHFGNDIMDELFNRYTGKVAESSFFLNPEADKSIVLFVLLKNNN